MIPSDFELLEIPHFAPVLIEKTKQKIDDLFDVLIELDA